MSPSHRPDPARRAVTLAVANQKGGVAKTTTVASLGAALSELGRRVLLVDLDPQSCLTFSLGLDPETVTASLHEVLAAGLPLGEAVVSTAEGMDLVPAAIDLAGTEAMLLARPGREYSLREALGTLAQRYDVMLLDCSPSLGVLTLNALTAADEVLVPLQCEMLSHRGVGQLLDTISDVRRYLNHDLAVRGLLPTMYDGRSAHSRAVLADLTGRYGLPVLEPIPRSIRFAEAPAAGRSALSAQSSSRAPRGVQAYRDLAATLLTGWSC